MNGDGPDPLPKSPLARTSTLECVRGLGTIINVAAIVLGTTIGVLVGNRLPARTRHTVTDALGLVVLVIGALNIASLSDPSFLRAVGHSWPLLVVLGALVIGGIGGSLLRIEERVATFGGWIQVKMTRGKVSDSRERFIEGFVAASLLFCIGPLAILGALSDGLGHGINQLVLKSALDMLAATAFAATLGWGVAVSAIPVGIFQGLITVLGVLAGSFLPASMIAAITATGGILLLGIGLRLLQIKSVAVADLLPSLVVAPIIVGAITAFHS